MKKIKTRAPLAIPTSGLLGHACLIVKAYLENNHIPKAELPAMIRSVHGALGGVSGATVPDATANLKPAVPIKKSVTPDYIVCLEDGKQLKMLKRYLRSRYKMSPEEYRAKWGLAADYPMIAPNYAALRAQFARDNGLGRMPVAERSKRRRG